MNILNPIKFCDAAASQAHHVNAHLEKKGKKRKRKKQIASSKAQSINRFPALLCFQVIIVEK
jgi:hypothetical protein